ncbi:hypothetical protein QAD02_023746 [Eretmocerus hayati]|uniref:Uncharacterized protein n=1 Tax=Eretmocerus hayati TaxID=131215 RepID=A0ACC2PWQ0_9HYME|nr:hypothetical protein QAD02_023746 [Eretmocerus hayati]
MASIFRLVFLLVLIYGDRIDRVTSDSLTTSEKSTSDSTELPKPVEKVCDKCRCTVEIVDCSNMGLTSNLHDHEWPKASREVNFNDNNITWVRQFPKVLINRLSFRNNAIEKIDNQAFRPLAGNFTELDLSHNLLSFENFKPIVLDGRYADEAYEPLGNLRMLNLSGNKFHSLDKDLFEHVQDLHVLDLSDNPFSIFDHAATMSLTDLPYLSELYLSRCKLKKLDATTLHVLSHLKKLDLTGNEFSVLPDALQDTNSLETLILDQNSIEYLGPNNSFPIMFGLKYLSLSSMPKLSIIDKGALSNLQALETLVVENCPLLTEIHEDALIQKRKGMGPTWPSMKKLHLVNNSLRYLPFTLIARWDLLEELHVTNNKWSCDCINQHFIGTLLPNLGSRLMSLNESLQLVCSGPVEMKNINFTTLAGRELRCLDAYGSRPDRDATIMIGALVGVLLAIPLVLGFLLLWSRGYFFCGEQGPASYSRAFYKRARPFDDDCYI